MAVEETGPFKPADLVDLKSNLAKLDQAELELERAVRAGIDMTGQRTQLRELREKLTKVRQAYFPGQ